MVFSKLLISLVLAFQPNLNGDWVLTSEDDFLECSDMIVITDSKLISIVNECYGIDPDIVGKASFTIKDNVIEFAELSFTSNYEAFLDEDNYRFEYDSKGDSLMMKSLKTGIVEKWVKLVK